MEMIKVKIPTMHGEQIRSYPGKIITLSDVEFHYVLQYGNLMWGFRPGHKRRWHEAKQKGVTFRDLIPLLEKTTYELLEYNSKNIRCPKINLHGWPRKSRQLYRSFNKTPSEYEWKNDTMGINYILKQENRKWQ